jgi:copper chaperone CopZ
MFPRILLCLLLASGFAQAEFLQIQVFIRDMSCPSCTDTLVAAFKRLKGVEHVEVDFKEGTVRLELAAQNRVGVEQAWDAIKRVGFTPGETKVTVRGTVKGTKLEVPEIGKTFQIDGHAPEGDAVELKGTITPPPDPRTPVVIRVVGSGK